MEWSLETNLLTWLDLTPNDVVSANYKYIQTTCVHLFDLLKLKERGWYHSKDPGSDTRDLVITVTGIDYQYQMYPFE